jgi:hypothetical protein
MSQFKSKLATALQRYLFCCDVTKSCLANKNLDRVFTSKSGCMRVMRLIFFLTKRPSLDLKTCSFSPVRCCAGSRILDNSTLSKKKKQLTEKRLEYSVKLKF